VENARLRAYVQDRLSGQVRRPDGTPVVGPVTAPWKGRNKPRRQDRGWATAWSPEQISNRLKVDFPDDESMRISHEAIYQALYVQSRSSGSWSPACAADVRYVFPAPARLRRPAWTPSMPSSAISSARSSSVLAPTGSARVGVGAGCLPVASCLPRNVRGRGVGRRWGFDHWRAASRSQGLPHCLCPWTRLL
jgi:hypothetical protein